MTVRLTPTSAERREPGLDLKLRLVLALLIALAAWFAWHSSLRALLTPMPEAVEAADENFQMGEVTPAGTVEVTGFRPCENGWCLPVKTSGVLTYRFVAQGERPFLNLWLYPPPGGSSRLSIAIHGGSSYQTVPQSGTTVNVMTRVDPRVQVRPGQVVALRFEATNPGASELLVLDKFRLFYRTALTPDVPDSRMVFGLVLSFGLAIAALCRRWHEALVTVLILAAAAAFRYGAAIALADVALDPDAIDYRAYARRMALFTETGFFSARFAMREPLFVLVAHLFFKLVGEWDFAFRLLTVILSTAAIWPVMRLGRTFFGRVPGWIIGAAMALNGPLVLESPRALRLEFEILLLAAYIALAFVVRWRRLLPAALALAVAGVVLVLTRSTYMPVVLAMNAYVFLRFGSLKGWVGGMALTVALIAACLAPIRYNMYRIHNDAFMDTANYARWNANLEFAGKPGFPTLEEFQVDPFRGPHMTYGEYMFGLHTPTEIAIGVVRGYMKLFRAMLIYPLGLPAWGRLPQLVNTAFQGLALAGFVLALWMPRYRWLPLLFLLLEFPVSFLYDRNLVEPYRHSYSSYPLVLFAATLTVVTLWRRASQTRTPLLPHA